jgi:hypothetical protein
MPQSPSPSIPLVADQPAVRDLVALALLKVGYQIETATTAHEVPERSTRMRCNTSGNRPIWSICSGPWGGRLAAGGQRP